MNHLQTRQLSPELAHVATTELNENPSKISEDVEYLRKWLQMQPHIFGRTGYLTYSYRNKCNNLTIIFQTISFWYHF